MEGKDMDSESVLPDQILLRRIQSLEDEKNSLYLLLAELLLENQRLRHEVASLNEEDGDGHLGQISLQPELNLTDGPNKQTVVS
jgi:hypothetical protein